MRWTVLARSATAVAGCLLIATGDEGELAGLAELTVTDPGGRT